MGRPRQGAFKKVALAVAVLGATTVGAIGTSQAGSTKSSSEVNLNVVAKRVLGLPDPK